MSFYLTWIIAEHNQAKRICDVKNEFNENLPRLEIKGLSQLELSFLWAIIKSNPSIDDPKVEWNPDYSSNYASKPLATIPDLIGLSQAEAENIVAKKGLSTVQEVSTDFISLLAELLPEDIDKYAIHWKKYEEMQTYCELYENTSLAEIIRDLSAFARESIKCELPVLDHSVI